MKAVMRSVAMALFAAFCLGLMVHFELINGDDLAAAFVHAKKWLLMAFLSILSVLIIMMFRYFYLLKMLRIYLPLKQVAAATFVSNALGQWAPGSLAVIELVRIGLMVGADRVGTGTGGSLENGTASAGAGVRPEFLKSRLAVVSLLDRFCGFFTMLSIGGFTSFLFLLLSDNNESAHHQQLLLTLSVGSLGGAAFLFCLPFLSRSAWCDRVLGLLNSVCVSPSGRVPHFAQRLLGKAVVKFALLRGIVASDTRDLRLFVLPVFLSLLMMVGSCLSLYFCSRATGTEIPFFSILSVFPVMAVAGVLPLGFAGLGGYQLVAVALFQVFGLKGADVATANVLSAGVNIAVNSLLGLFFLKMSSSQIAAILRK